MENFFESSVYEFFSTLIHQRAFLTAFMGWLAAQATKSIISVVVNLKAMQLSKKQTLVEEENEDVNMVKDMVSSLFWKTGGMPSSHASMTTALTVAIGFETGFTSNIFIVAFFFTTVVLRDATGVRLLAGKLARITNTLVEKHNINLLTKEKLKTIKVIEGHTLSEVFVGVLLGVFIAIIIYQF